MLFFNIWTFSFIIFLIIIELALAKFCFHAIQDIHKLVNNYRTPIIGFSMKHYPGCQWSDRSSKKKILQINIIKQ